MSHIPDMGQAEFENQKCRSKQTLDGGLPGVGKLAKNYGNIMEHSSHSMF